MTATRITSATVVVTVTAAVTAIAALALSPVPAAAQDPTFGGDELKKAWADKELMGRARTGATFYMSFKADGTSSFALNNNNDTGVWRATDTGYCVQWQRIREGKEGCFVVRKSGSVFITYDEAGSEVARIHNVR